MWLECDGASPGSSAGKESACNGRDLGLIPGWEDPLGEGMATHSSILFSPGESPWTEEPRRQYSLGYKESDLTERLSKQEV